MNPNECKVQLKWNDFQANLPLSLQDVRESRMFSDVTLVSDENTVFEAHRIILVNCFARLPVHWRGRIIWTVF